MMTAWLLNEIGLLVTTIGALLMFLYLSPEPQFATAMQPQEAKQGFLQYHRHARVGVGLLAAWLVLQDLALLLA